MRVTGETINNMALVKRSGIMVLRPMKVNLLKVKRMARVNSHGVMAPTMKEISSMACSRVSELTSSRKVIRPSRVNSMMVR